MDLLSRLSVGLFANRYLSAIAVTVSLWDHLITFDEEYRAVWANRSEHVLLKVAYLSCRYASDAILLFSAYTLSGSADLDKTVGKNKLEPWGICQAYIWCFVWLGFCFIAITQVLVGYRIHTLWEHRRRITYTVFGVFVIFAVAAAVLAALAGAEVARKVVYMEIIRSCVFFTKSRYVPWSVGLLVAFDLFLVLVTVANALDRPRTKDIEILERLNRDGARSFMGLFVLLFIALCLIIWGSLEETYMFLPPTWAFSSIITSRLFCRVNITKKKSLKRKIRAAVRQYSDDSRKERQFLLPALSF